MKILVLGASGMLGHKLCQHLSPRFDVLGTVREPDGTLTSSGGNVVTGVDALAISSVESAIANFAPDVVINCIGVVKQAAAAKDPANTLLVNSVFPHQLRQIADALGIRLISISTDCVFTGRRG